MNPPKYLVELLGTFSWEELVKWFEDIPKFFFRPSKFFEEFWSKPLPKKFQQIIFYALLDCLILFLFPDPSLSAAYALLVKILKLAIFSTACLAPAIWLVTRQWHLKKVFAIHIICLCLFWLPEMTCEMLFVNNENYTFHFISKIFSNWSTLYLIFLPSIILITTKNKRLIGSLLTVLAWNIYLLMLAIVTPLIDDQNCDDVRMTSYDAISQEFNIYAEKLEDFGAPRWRLDVHSRGSVPKILVGNLQDSSFDFNINYDTAFLNPILARNIEKLDSTENLLHFKSNKNMFRELKTHFLSFRTYFQSTPCDTCLVDVSVIRDSSGRLERMDVLYVVDSTYLKPYANFQRQRLRRMEIVDRASLPDYLTTPLFLPLQAISSFAVSSRPCYSFF